MHKPATESPASRQTGLVLIGAFKLLKGVLLVAVGVGALKLLDKDLSEVAAHWVDVLRVDPDNRFIHKVLVKILSLDDHRLKEISAGTFFYAALLLTEGTGLLLRKRWAEYFTVIATASFLPLEVFELVKKFTAARVIVIAINALIVWYLIAHLRRQTRHR